MVIDAEGRYLMIVHYVETRDMLEVKVSTVNRRLQRLIVEGEHVCEPCDERMAADASSGGSNSSGLRNMPKDSPRRPMS